jgi:hypothetical protein
MLSKIQKLKTWQAACIVAIVGLTTFFSGLRTPFQGDDKAQILNNVPVHSLANIVAFFKGGTFYYGPQYPLSGDYYRPLMTTVFSLIYTIFGPHTFWYHLVQLLIYIASAVLLYAIFRFSFKPALALVLSLIFLVHPINSQNVFYIAQMQDVLYVFFGLLAFYILLKHKSRRSLFAVALCLILSLLSKETAILFVVMSGIYLLWYNKKRFLAYLEIMILPLILYMVLRTHAIGLFVKPSNVPIDRLTLVGRLLTAPSVFSFYISKFLFPWKLASGYFWSYSTFSFQHVLLPLLIDLIIIGVVIAAILLMRRKASKANTRTFLFFAIWSGLGLFMLVQIVPLDYTADETWFYFPIIGVLGMIGIAYSSFKKRIHIDHRILATIVVLLIIVLGIRTAVRGTNWSSQDNLAYHDITASKEDYFAYNNIAYQLDFEGKPKLAQKYSQKSVAIFPEDDNCDTLGIIDAQLKEYPQSYVAFINGLKYQENPQVDEQLYYKAAILMIWYGNPSKNISLLEGGVSRFPQDGKLWTLLAIIEYRNNDVADAQNSIRQAYFLSSSAETSGVYHVIMNNEKMVINPLD